MLSWLLWTRVEICIPHSNECEFSWRSLSWACVFFRFETHIRPHEHDGDVTSDVRSISSSSLGSTSAGSSSMIKSFMLIGTPFFKVCQISGPCFRSCITTSMAWTATSASRWKCGAGLTYHLQLVDEVSVGLFLVGYYCWYAGFRYIRHGGGREHLCVFVLPLWLSPFV